MPDLGLSGSAVGEEQPVALLAARPPRSVKYRLVLEQGNHVIERVESFGPFESREAARQYMIDTTEERKVRDA